MKDKTFTVNLNCLFCDCPLEHDSEKELSSGDMLKCQNCEELNDYDALIDVAAEKGKAIAVDFAKDEVNKMLQKMFKK